MTLLDSRRLTGPGLLLDGPGAVVDIRLEDAEREAAISAWREAAGRLLQAVGWEGETLATRSYPSGVSLAMSAPVDGLYAATELNERAWDMAAAALQGTKPPDLRAAVAAVLDEIANERSPRLVALYRAARELKRNFLSGEDLVSVGSGRGVQVWRADELPDAGEVEWDKVHDIPLALVTGSNGKTTVVRLLAALARATGSMVGMTSTDGVILGSEVLEEGDFSGPSGARMLLRRQEVEAAILETARGGILRRGLPVEYAEVAVVTNIADDHLGEFGIVSLDDLAQTKLVVARGLKPDGRLVLNADDPLLVKHGAGLGYRIIWFSLAADSPVVSRHLEQGGTAALLEGKTIVVAQGKNRTPVIEPASIPFTYGGIARHNVANLLAAVAAGVGFGVEVPAITRALSRFGRDLEDTPGRVNLIELGGIRVLIDFAHNPHGMAALVAVARTLPARRRLLLIGQAGDRNDTAIRELARAGWELRPDHVVVKDMEAYLRGRAPGEVPSLLADEFSKLGLDAEAITDGGEEIDAVGRALEWAHEGDLLVMAVHQNLRAVMELIGRLKLAGWRAGDPVPKADSPPGPQPTG